MTSYQQTIKRLTGCSASESRHVEGVLRSLYSTLGGLSPAMLKSEAQAALSDVRQTSDKALLDRLAASYGL